MTANQLLNDSIMITIYCPEMDSYVLSHLSTGWNVPFMFCTEGSWRKCAITLYDSLLGPNPPDTLEMKRVYRVWRGENQLPLQNIVFHAKVNQTALKGLNSGGSLAPEVVSVENLRFLINRKELTPEIENFLEISFGEQTTTRPNFPFHQSSSNLIEMMKNDIFTAKEDSGKLSSLISSLHLLDDDQMILYELYLSSTFPYLMMDEPAMSSFMRKLAVIPFNSDYFRSADVSNLGCIDFKQLLGFISAINPQATRDGPAADQRCRYVFRYYDKDRDDRLSIGEFSKIVDDVAATKRYLNDKKGLMNSFKDGFISILEFARLVGSLKLRGTSSLMTASLPIRGRIDELRYNIKTLKDDGNVKEAKSNNHIACYSLAGHVVDLTSEGEINLSDIRKIHTAIKTDTSSGTQPESIMPTTSSMETFETQTSAMYVLDALKYCSEEFANLSGAQSNWWGDKFSDYQLQFIQCCQKVQGILENEPRLLRIESPVYIIGDIHGNYQIIMAFQKWFWGVGLECTPGSLLFLGDYVDRGMNSVEVIGYLIAQKLKTPKKIFLLRGNHEIRKVQKEFTFFAECLTKFDKGGMDVWNAANELFDRLPLAALIDNQIFCCHGGIPMPSTCESLTAIDFISCPLPEPAESKLAWSLLWNDPRKIGYNYIPGKKVVEGGFSRNTRRKTGHTFDSSALQSFIGKHRLAYVVRAHEVQEEGFQVDLNNKLITVFSSSYYKENNKAGCVLVEQNKLRIFTMLPAS